MSDPNVQSILGQLDAMEIMIAGLNQQIIAIRRSLVAVTPDRGYRQVKQPDNVDSGGYTSKEEDDRLERLLGFDGQKDQLLSDLTSQVTSEGAHGEARATDFEQ